MQHTPTTLSILRRATVAGAVIAACTLPLFAQPGAKVAGDRQARRTQRQEARQARHAAWLQERRQDRTAWQGKRKEHRQEMATIAAMPKGATRHTARQAARDAWKGQRIAHRTQCVATRIAHRQENQQRRQANAARHGQHQRGAEHKAAK